MATGYGQARHASPHWLRPAPELLVCFGDCAAILTIPLASSLLRQSTENLARNLAFWPLLSCITVLLIASHGGYKPAAIRAPQKPAILAINCFLATSIALLTLSVLLGHPHILARRWTAADLILTPLILGFTRSVLSPKVAAWQGERPPSGPVIVCYDHLPRDFTAALRDQHLPEVPRGILYLSKRRRPGTFGPELADAEALRQALRGRDVQDVIFVHHLALDAFAANAGEDLLAQLLVYPARIWLAFELPVHLPEALCPRARCKLVPLVTDNLISTVNPGKRVFDLAVSFSLLVSLSWLLLVVALLVRLSGPGPVVFRQTRTGAQGRSFTVLKFRTMRHAPEMRFAQARVADPRVTYIGRLLRRTSLDEILQLINVLKGEMSMVGPRPHAPETEVEGISFEDAARWYRLRHRVKPGITGLAQIRGQRGETRAISTLEQRLASDMEYIQSWSLLLDAMILLRTLPVVFSQVNAV